jgi:hypothetical protein
MNVKLLKDLDFASKLNNCNAVTEAGKEMVKNYKAYLFTNPASCGIVNGFVQEAQKYSFDTGLAGILESVLGFINENKISWQLASACESIENNRSTYNYIARTGVEQVGKLLEMDEAQVVSYIKSGALKGVQYIPEFRNVCKQVFKSTIMEAATPQYSVVNPISYIYENEEGDKYFNVLNKTYKINKDQTKVCEAVCDDVKFRNINALLESFTNDEGVLSYSWKSGFDTCKVVIKEAEEKTTLEFTKGQRINETFEEPAKFIEYCDTLSKALTMNERFDFMSKTAAIGQVFEAFGQVFVMDCSKVLRTSTGVCCTIVEAKDNVTMTVNNSVHSGIYTKDFEYMTEALKEVTAISGIDLKHLFEERINEDVKKQNPDQYKQIQEELAAQKDAQMEARKKKIAMLAEQYKNDPAIIAVLNKAARDLALLESGDKTHEDAIKKAQEEAKKKAEEEAKKQEELKKKQEEEAKKAEEELKKNQQQ